MKRFVDVLGAFLTALALCILGAPFPARSVRAESDDAGDAVAAVARDAGRARAGLRAHGLGALAGDDHRAADDADGACAVGLCIIEFRIWTLGHPVCGKEYLR